MEKMSIVVEGKAGEKERDESFVDVYITLFAVPNSDGKQL